MQRSNSAAGALQVPRQMDLVCLSHLRWDFVFQRPQHLMTRFARGGRVFFVEEPVYHDGAPSLDQRTAEGGVQVVVPHLPHGSLPEEAEAAQRYLLAELLDAENIEHYVLWYYTPMALGFSDDLRPAVTVFDSMDELSMFDFAPPELLAREEELFRRADVVFTGGQSLYEAKRDRHPNVHLFASSIDRDHFAAARAGGVEPPEQAGIAHPRLGFFGVIDERIDRELLAELADARPDWQLVMIGPVVKIDPGQLPQRPNIHWLGGREYRELPRYIAGWDVALMPWAINRATRFISPTKTPEYLAAGRPVVSARIADVVRPFEELGLVRIADDAAGFVREIEALLAQGDDERRKWLERVERFLATTSWEQTWRGMQDQIDAVFAAGEVTAAVAVDTAEQHATPNAAAAAT